jgi:protein-disulfide isomerase
MTEQLATYFVHFPLPRHTFARPAARAAECASDQDRVLAFHDLLYEKQDSLGLKPWSSYASEAMVPDMTRFASCVTDTAIVARIEAGIALGKRLALRGTPTVLVNGWRFEHPPTQVELLQTIEALREGKQPLIPSR